MRDAPADETVRSALRAAQSALPQASVALALQAGAAGVWEWDTRNNLMTITHQIPDLPTPAANATIPLAVMLDHIALLDRPSVRRALELSRASDDPINVEFRLAHSPRDARWLVFRGKRLPAPRSDVFTGILADVSDQRHTSDRMLVQQDALVELARHPSIADGRLTQALRLITAKCAAVLGIARVSVWLFNADHSELNCEDLYELMPSGEGKHSSGTVLTAAQYPRYFRAVEEARVLPASDARTDPRTSEYEMGYLLPLGIDSMLDAPIRRGGKLVGILCNESVNARRIWTTDEQNFAASMGDLIGNLLESADRKRYAAALAETNERHHAALANSEDMLWRAEVDPPVSIAAGELDQIALLAAHARVVEIGQSVSETRFTDRNAQLTNYSLGDIVDHELLEVSLGQWIRSGYQIREQEVRVRATPGQKKPVWLSISYFAVIEDGLIKRIWGAQHRIDDRKQAQASLEHRASHDTLTRLPNRVHFLATLREHIRVATVSNGCALYVFDLDHFKEVNDTLGHQAGDELLCAIGPRLRPLLAERPRALVARVGGDEFAVLVPGVSESEAAEIGATLVDALHAPYEIRGMRLELEASLGWVTAPQQGVDPEELFRRADVAMYTAKSARSGLRRYASDLDGHTHRRLTLMMQLGNAISQGQLFIKFQPIVELKDKRLSGFESLVRWQHPTFGEIGPGEFIRLAEMTRSIEALSLWVLDASVALGCEMGMRENGLTVNVNFSPRLLGHVDVGTIINAVRKHNVDLSQVTLEITETAVIADAGAEMERLAALRAAGFKVAIDDFGTGYSSLNLLRNLEADAIKIDPGFVSKMLTRQRDAQIVHAMIGLARSLGIRVVAEGVEDHAVLAALVRLGCDAVQGFNIARPMRKAELVRWVALWRQDAIVGAAPVPTQ